MGKHHKNTLFRIRKMCDIVQQHYESGNYAKSYYKVWKQYVYPVYPMCYDTLLKYINTPLGELQEPAVEDKLQLKLFDDENDLSDSE